VTIAEEHRHHYYIHHHPAHGVFYEPGEELRREQKLYRDREIHSEPLTQPIYDYPFEEEYERVMAEEHYHPHLKEIPSLDIGVPLGQEEYVLPQLPAEPIAEPIEIRPMARARRLTDSEDEESLYRIPEMDELLFNEVWDVLDNGRRRFHRLSEIQEETLSFGPESSSSKPSSEERKLEIHHELPQIRYEQYGKAPHYDVVHVDSSDSQAISPEADEGAHHYDYIIEKPQDEYFLHYAPDITQSPLEKVLPPEVDLNRQQELSYEVYERPPTPHPYESPYSSEFSESEAEEHPHRVEPVVYDKPYQEEPLYAEIGQGRVGVDQVKKESFTFNFV
jgi:hypothetical protein